MYKAVIFDMDGVLINSEIEYLKLWMKFYEESGAPADLEELRYLAGSPHSYENELICKKLCVDMPTALKLKENFFRQHPVDYKSIKKDYVNELLEYVKRRGIVVALASSSTTENIKTVLFQCGIRQYFSMLISGEMFTRTKPDPEIYEYTAGRLGFPKEEILVVEDSDYGIRAAKAAGLSTAAVNDPILKFDNQEADYIVDSLRGVERILEDDWLHCQRSRHVCERDYRGA